MNSIRVLIADDESLIRHALRLFLTNEDGLEVIGEAISGQDAVDLALAHKPDIVLMDLQMPGMDGIEATSFLSTALPCTRILAVTTFSSEERIVAALRAGADGYLLKDTSPSELIQAIKETHAGRSALSPSISRELIRTVRGSADPAGRNVAVVAGREASLTPREHSIVQLLSQGLSNAEISRRLFISEATVKSNFGRIMQKWGVRDRVQVLIRAAKLGLVTF